MAWVSLFVIFLCLIWQVSLLFSERVNLAVEDSITQCTAVVDSNYFSQISQARLILKSMMVVCELPGLSVALSKDGQLIWSEAFGFADLESTSLACPSSIFRIGSISKTLTAVAFLRLVEQGKIHPDDDIRRIVSEYPDKGFPITPLQLATHTAGIRSYLDDSEALVTQQFNSAIESLDLFKNDALVFQPGTQFEYSNYGYVLLSAAMEKVCNEDFLSVISNEIMIPMGMANTIPEFNERKDHNICTFYDNETPYSLDGQINKSPYINYSSKWASGGFLSTAEDLIRFSDSLDKQFLNRESEDLMYHPHASRLILKYGIGWMIAHDPYLRKIYFHFGAGSGSTSVIAKFPHYDTDLVILSNLGHAKFPYSHLMRLINQFLPRYVYWIFYSIDFLVLSFMLSIIWRKISKSRS